MRDKGFLFHVLWDRDLNFILQGPNRKTKLDSSKMIMISWEVFQSPEIPLVQL